MTPEQKQQRIEQIEKRSGTVYIGLMQEDIDFLLSLVKSQEAGDDQTMDKREYSELWRLKHKMKAGQIVAVWKADIGQVVKYERMESDITAALGDAATSMRSACVEKVKALAVTHRAMAKGLTDSMLAELQKIRAEECDSIAELLQSVTLQEQEAKQS